MEPNQITQTPSPSQTIPKDPLRIPPPLQGLTLLKAPSPALKPYTPSLNIPSFNARSSIRVINGSKRSPSDTPPARDASTVSLDRQRPVDLADQTFKRIEWFNEFILEKRSAGVSPKHLKPKSRFKNFTNALKKLVITLPIPWHRNSKGIAKALLDSPFFLRACGSPNSTDHSFQFLMNRAISEANDRRLPCYEIVFSLIAFFKDNLTTSGYALPYVAKTTIKLTARWRRLLPSHRVSEAVNEEVNIRKEEKLRKKAADILYHLLDNPLFNDVPNLHTLKTCAARCGRMKKPKEATQQLAFTLAKFLETIEGGIAYIDPYQDCAHVFDKLSEALSQDYSTYHSTKEEIADALHLILEKRMREAHNLGGQQEEEEKRRNHLKLMHFVNLGYCSKHFITYDKWHQEVCTFFRTESFENIKTMLEPLKGCPGIGELIKGLIKKNRRQERIVAQKEVEIFESALFYTNRISLELLQSFFETRISMRMEWERRANKSNPQYKNFSDENLRKLFLSQEEPWSDLLPKYINYSKLEEHLPAHLRVKEIPRLRQILMEKTHPEKIKSTEPIERVWKDLQKTHYKTESISKEEISPEHPMQIQSEYSKFLYQLNLRRFLFSKKMRLFLHKTVPGSCLEKMFYTEKGFFVTPFNDTFKEYQDNLKTKFYQILSKDQTFKAFERLLKRALSSDEVRDKEELKQIYTKCALDIPCAERLVSYLTIDFDELEEIEKKVSTEMTQNSGDERKEAVSDDNSGSFQKKEYLEKEHQLINSLFDVNICDSNDHIVKVYNYFEELFFATLGVPTDITFEISANSAYISTVNHRASIVSQLQVEETGRASTASQLQVKETGKVFIASHFRVEGTDDYLV